MSFACLSDRITVAKFKGNKKDLVDMVIGLTKMFGDKSRIRKVAIVENGAATLPSVGGDGVWSPQCTVCRIFCIQ